MDYPSDGHTASLSSGEERATNPPVRIQTLGDEGQVPPSGTHGPPPGRNFTLPNGQIIRPSEFGMNENQFGLLLTTIQGCFGSNNLQPPQPTPPTPIPRQAEPAQSRNEHRPIQQRLGEQAQPEDLRHLLNRRAAASHEQRGRCPEVPQVGEVGTSRQGAQQQVPRDQMAESTP